MYNATAALTAISSEKTGEICVPLVANTTFKILPLPAKYILRCTSMFSKGRVYSGLTCSQEEHILVETLTSVLTSDNTDCVYHHLRNTAAEHARVELVVTCYT